MDLIWSYPVLLLGVALGVTLAVSGIDLGFTTLRGGSLVLPALIIGVVYVPYMARPLRAQTIELRRREFVDAARQQGLSGLRIMGSGRSCRTSPAASSSSRRCSWPTRSCWSPGSPSSAQAYRHPLPPGAR